MLSQIQVQGKDLEDILDVVPVFHVLLLFYVRAAVLEVTESTVLEVASDPTKISSTTIMKA